MEMLRPGLTDMGEFARSLWLTTYNSKRDETEAVAWMLKNRLIHEAGRWLGGAPNGGERTPFFERGNCPLLLRLSRDFIREEYGPVSIGDDLCLSFDNVLFSRAFSIGCLVWNGDITDPTGGAVRCHRHDKMPEWARDLAPSALIGERMFYSSAVGALENC